MTSEAPTNWHQATVYAAQLPNDDPFRQQFPLLFAVGWFIVVVQTFTVVGMLTGTAQPACRTSDQCEQGRFCALGMRNRCGYCGDNAPMPLQVDMATSAGYNVIGCGGGWCGEDSLGYNDVPGIH